MYAILNSKNVVKSIDTRNVPLSNLVHKDLRHLYIEIANETEVELGDIWHPDTLTWEKPERFEDIEEIVEE